MEYLIGAALGLVIAGGARAIGLDRERGFYPVVLIVIASYYVLFAAMASPRSAIVVETAIAIGFVAIALIGFRTSRWLVLAAIAGHGVFDRVHHHLVDNPGVPRWWPGFCLAIDVGLAGIAALLLARDSRQSGTTANR